MSKYLVSTKSGRIYSIIDNKSYLLWGNTKKSIYTDDVSIRFIRKIDGMYWYGRSESLISLDKSNNIVDSPGLVDIKDMVYNDNYIFVLSGLRDSVYILDKGFNFLGAFNINIDGQLETFKSRQKQCNEINLPYFSIFYCPAMQNIFKFKYLFLFDNKLFIHGSKQFEISLDNLSFKEIKAIYYPKDLSVIDIENEIITDYLEC